MATRKTASKKTVTRKSASKKTVARKPAAKKTASKRTIHVDKVPKSAIKASSKQVSVGKLVAMAHKMNMDPKTLKSVLVTSGLGLGALGAGITFKHGGHKYLWHKSGDVCKVVGGGIKTGAGKTVTGVQKLTSAALAKLSDASAKGKASIDKSVAKKQGK